MEAICLTEQQLFVPVLSNVQSNVSWQRLSPVLYWSIWSIAAVNKADLRPSFHDLVFDCLSVVFHKGWLLSANIGHISLARWMPET